MLIGLFIFVLALFVILTYTRYQPSFGGVEQTTEAMEHKFFRLPLTKAAPGNSFLAELKANNTFYDASLTIDEFVYVLITEGQMQNATLLLKNISVWVPSHIGFNYSVNNQEIYSKEALSLSKSESTVKLSQQKLTLVALNITKVYDLAVTKLEVWQ